MHFDKAVLGKTLDHAVAARLRVDFDNAKAGKKTAMFGAEFEKILEDKAKKIVEKIAPVLSEVAKAHYKESLDLVGNRLNRGLKQGSPIYAGITADFKSFSAGYFIYKQRHFPENARKFWLRSGAMAAAYRQFAGNRKSAVSRTKMVVKLHSKKLVYRKRTYRFTLDMAFTPIANPFMDAVFRRAYLTASTQSLSGLSLSGFGTSSRRTDPLARLAFNETTGKAPRPFMAALMAKRGAELQTLMNQRIRRFK